MKEQQNTDQLIILAQHGDEDAFLKIFNKYLPLVRKLLGSFCASLDDGEREDALQEAHFALYRAVMTYRAGSVTFGAYAGTCIKNRLISYLRGLKNQLPEFVTVTDLSDESDLDPRFTAQSPEQSFIDREAFQAFFQSVVDNFTPLEGRVFELYIKGYSYREIALSLSINEKSVDNAVNRLKTKLKKQLRG